MSHLAQGSHASIYFEMTWECSHASHIERFMAPHVNFLSDTLPLGLKSRMKGLGVGDSVEMTMDESDVPPFEQGKVLDLSPVRFLAPARDGRPDRPRIGRHYPQNMLDEAPGASPNSPIPFRVVATDKAGFKADLNHPIAGRTVRIKATVIDILDVTKRDSAPIQWTHVLLDGPGVQARLPETPTDFLGAHPFDRADETDDADFYAGNPALPALTGNALDHVIKIHDDLLQDGMEVLDLMSGEATYLPLGFKPGSVTGVGLDEKAMGANPALDKCVVFNLNETPRLPFDDNRFDAVLCTASVQYLTKPFEIFEDIGRILKPGGVFVVTFADRWLEAKVIRIWPELYEFERMGLVSQYMVKSGSFGAMTTLSAREYQGEGSTFAVWGIKA